MNTLYVSTRPTDPERPHTFDVRWMSGKDKQGTIEVTLPEGTNDPRIIAELSVLRHLVLEREILGPSRTGNGLRFVVSAGAIKKLMREDSAKAHLAPYALFLRTRLLGVVVEVDHKANWVSDATTLREVLVIEEPPAECISIAGYGEVQVRAHVLERIQQHYGVALKNLWKFVTNAAKEAQPATMPTRNVRHDVKHRQPGQYALNTRYNILFVIVPPVGAQKQPQLVTAHPPVSAMVQVARHAA
jgi:hypothetical protein